MRRARFRLTATAAWLSRLARADTRFVKETKGRFTLSAVLDEVRGAIEGDGWAGLERLAKKYGLPVMVLATGLGMAAGQGPAPAQEVPQ